MKKIMYDEAMDNMECECGNDEVLGSFSEEACNKYKCSNCGNVAKLTWTEVE